MYRYLKRVIDFALAFLLLILLILPFIIIFLLVKSENPKAPVFFSQKRVGQNEKLFNMYKFRSMRADTPDVATHLLENPDKYITPIGKILRKTSLDELPQLFNILKGEMSFIGPRPALYNQDDLVELRRKYHAQKAIPGLTGLAQISGRDELELDEKARLDGVYVQNISFSGDLTIFFKTFASVFRAHGVKEGKHE